MTVPQRWSCPRCPKTYVSPLPLKHPPVHSCEPKTGPRRLRSFVPDTRPVKAVAT